MKINGAIAHLEQQLPEKMVNYSNKTSNRSAVASDKFVKEILEYTTKTKPFFDVHVALKRKEILPNGFLQLPSKNGI